MRVGLLDPRDDLDIYRVMSGNGICRREIATPNSDDIITVDTMLDGVRNACKNADMYGSYECFAMRDGILAYENQDVDGWRALRGALDKQMRLPDCSARWLDIAKSHIDACGPNMGAPAKSLDCMMYAMSIRASLAAALTYDDIRFKHTKHLTGMVCMMRDASLIDAGMLDGSEHWARPDMAGKHGAADVRRAERAAKSAYTSIHTYVDI